MYIARKRSLACSRFTVDQYPALVLGDLSSLLPELIHHPAFANRLDHRLSVLSQTDIFPMKFIAFERALDRQEQFGE